MTQTAQSAGGAANQLLDGCSTNPRRRAAASQHTGMVKVRSRSTGGSPLRYTAATFWYSMRPSPGQPGGGAPPPSSTRGGSCGASSGVKLTPASAGSGRQGGPRSVADISPAFTLNAPWRRLQTRARADSRSDPAGSPPRSSLQRTIAQRRRPRVPPLARPLCSPPRAQASPHRPWRCQQSSTDGRPSSVIIYGAMRSLYHTRECPSCVSND